MTDQNNNVLRTYDYVYSVKVYNNTSTFSDYTTQISAWSVINGQIVQKSISAYDDANGTFANQFIVNGQAQNFNYSINTASLGDYVQESNLNKMLQASVTMTINNDYPGILSGSTPVRSVTYNPYTHRINSLKDYNSNVSNYIYDNLNRLTQKTVAVGSKDSQITTYSYTNVSDGSINKYPTPNTIVTDSQTVTNTIDPNGWITQQVISYPQGGNSKTIGYSYYTDAAQANYGLVSNVDGPRSDVNDNVSFTYDGFGNKATATQVVNNRTIVTKYLNYNSFSQPERIVYPSGLVGQFIYDIDGTLKAKITGNGGDTGNISGTTTSYTYDYMKRKKSETNPDNETTLYDYDGLGRLIKTTTPDGSISAQTYFDTGEVQSIGGASSTYNEINSVGQISKSRSGTDTSALWKTFIYDGNGNITQTQTALGIIEKWTYDALNRNTSYTDGEGNISTKSYDKTNNLTSSKDAVNSGSNPFNYVSSTLVKDEINNDYAKKNYVYNQHDQVINKYHGSRSCEFAGVDTLGREASVNCTSENSGDPAYAYNYQYTYDNSRFGRLDQVSSNASFGVDTKYNYDNLDRIVGKTQTNKAISTWGGANGSLSVGYTYSAANKIISLTLPSGRVINYNYDGNKGRLSSIDINNIRYINNINYNENGYLSGWNIENTNSKFNINYSSDTNYVSSVIFNDKSNAQKFLNQYNYDNDGNTIQIIKSDVKETNLIGGSTRIINGISITYDNNKNLKKEINFTKKNNLYSTGVTYSFNYDKNNNRISDNKLMPISSQDIKKIYNYYINTNKIQLDNSNYLNTGELRLSPFISGYDGNGQMRYSGGASGQYYMAYNHKNERTVRSLNAGGSWYNGAIQYIYDESSNLIGEYTAGGTPIVEYIWKGNRLVAAVYGSGNSSKIYAVITDKNNTPRMLFDNTANSVVWLWKSSAFGVGKPTGSITFNLRFPGQYYDEFTGLHYNLNRYYNPDLGRYMEPDPKGLEGGVNPYTYAGNNPINNIDPDGTNIIDNRNGTITIRPNIMQAPSLTIPYPKGWDAASRNLTPSSPYYHEYNYQFTVSGIYGKGNIRKIQNSIEKKPTPGNGSASKNGADINAEPWSISSLSQSVRSFGAIFTDSPVKSYTVQNEYGTWVYNVTQSGHPLSNGYVLRGSIPGAEGAQIINYGEGNGSLQANELTVDFVNRVWIYGTQNNLELAFPGRYANYSGNGYFNLY